MKKILIVVCGLVLAACANTPKKNNDDLPFVSYSPFEQVTAIDHNVGLYLQAPDFKQGQILREQLQSIVTDNPEYRPVLYSLYRLNYTDAQNPQLSPAQHQSIMASLKDIYLKLPPSIKKDFFPPALAEYQYQGALVYLSQEKEFPHQKFVAILLEGLEQDPLNAKIYPSLVHHLLALDKPLLAYAILIEASRQSPENPDFLANLGDYWYRDANNMDCPAESKESVARALDYYRQSLQLNPQNDLHFKMGLLYGYLGLNPLAQNEAQYLTSKNNLQAYWQAGYLYTHIQAFDYAKSAFDAAEKIANLTTKPQSTAFIEYLISTKQWQAAAIAMPKYLKTKKNVYADDFLMAMNIVFGADQAGLPIKINTVWPEDTPKFIPSGYATAMLGLIMGKVTADEVKPKIKTQCGQANLALYAALMAKNTTPIDTKKVEDYLTEFKKLVLPMQIETNFGAYLVNGDGK